MKKIIKDPIPMLFFLGFCFGAMLALRNHLIPGLLLMAVSTGIAVWKAVKDEKRKRGGHIKPFIPKTKKIRWTKQNAEKKTKTDEWKDTAEKAAGAGKTAEDKLFQEAEKKFMQK